jgi:Cu+-exporting ATPase
MRVTATGEATALAHIIAAVQRAQGSRANIQRLGDRVSSVFVPVVVGVAVMAGLWWGLAPASAGQAHAWLARYLPSAHPPATPLAAALIVGASVLIIACPCAMGLATPAAIMAGSNAAAQRGILVRDGVALEKAGTVTAVLFDKTGTLTLGKPAVAATLDLGVEENDTRNSGSIPLADLAAGLARHSTHPISQAIAHLSQAAVGIDDWQEVQGSGVLARLRNPRSAASAPSSASNADAGALARLGAIRWLEEAGLDLAPGRDFITRWSAQGSTIVGVALDRRLVGLLAVKDTLKPGAREIIDQLKRQGLGIWLVTGDNSLTAASIGQQAGIAADRVLAEARPEQKAEFVKRLQAQGERVAFVGDGINDAPALEQADLGIAVSRASDVAREAADLILLRSEIGAIPEALGLARATLRTIKQNLFWAFFYNSLGIPLAALGLMSPILCAAAMGFSDLVVIGNALRLRRWRQ